MVHSIRALCQNTGGARQLSSLRRPPSTTEKRTFQLCLDTRIDITAPLGDYRSDTTAHSCSAVASAATSTVHHSVATSARTAPATGCRSWSCGAYLTRPVYRPASAISSRNSVCCTPPGDAAACTSSATTCWPIRGARAGGSSRRCCTPPSCGRRIVRRTVFSATLARCQCAAMACVCRCKRASYQGGSRNICRARATDRATSKPVAPSCSIRCSDCLTRASRHSQLQFSKSPGDDLRSMASIAPELEIHVDCVYVYD